MRRCCCQKTRKVRIKVREKEEIAQPGESLDAFMKTFDIREKRIGIVFKVIYVIAALFASVFCLSLTDRAKD